MDEETEFYAYDSTDDSDYTESENSPSKVRTVLATIGGAILASVAGYFLGWTVALIISRIANGGATA